MVLYSITDGSFIIPEAKNAFIRGGYQYYECKTNFDSTFTKVATEIYTCTCDIYIAMRNKKNKIIYVYMYIHTYYDVLMHNPQQALDIYHFRSTQSISTAKLTNTPAITQGVPSFLVSWIYGECASFGKCLCNHSDDGKVFACGREVGRGCRQKSASSVPNDV